MTSLSECFFIFFIETQDGVTHTHTHTHTRARARARARRQTDKETETDRQTEKERQREKENNSTIMFSLFVFFCGQKRYALTSLLVA